jgi:glycosyltransferase involved in cell wall biosynthesis
MTRALLLHQPVEGGVARHASDLFAGLRRYGYSAVLCGPQPPVTLQGSLESDEFKQLGMYRAIAPKQDAETIRSFVRIVRDVRPDVIHAHSSKAGAVARAARIACPGIPVVYTPHGYAMAGFFRRGERWLYREAERALGFMTTRVLAVCEAEATLARTITPRRRVTVVHNGVETADASGGERDPRVVSLAARGPVVSTVCGLRPGKGIETLIDAWPAVRSKVPGAQLVVVGDGVLRGELERRAAGLGAEDSVHFLGECEYPSAVLRAADVFALASWFEAFPYAVLDAMAIGSSIVASDVGGVSEAIEHGVDGLLVPPRSPMALSSAVVDLLEDAPLRARLGASARHTVSARFTTEAMVRGVAKVYEETIAPR